MVRVRLAHLFGGLALAGLTVGCQTAADERARSQPVNEWPSQQALRSLND